MNNEPGRLIGGLLLALYAGLVSAGYQLNLQPPVTRIASETYDLHILMMYFILVIFCVVFGVMFYSIYAHRKSVGHEAKQFHENTTVEIIWTVIPFVILIGMAWPATKTMIEFKDTANPDITIKATGYQWKWGYDYLRAKARELRSCPTWPRRRIRSTTGSPRANTTCSKWITR